MRCLHLDQNGRQCPAEAVEEGSLCPDHTPIIDPDTTAQKGFTPYFYRLVAALLLLIFLINEYQSFLRWLKY